MTLSACNIIHSKKTSWSQGGLGSMNYFPKTRCTLSVLKASSDITAAGSRTFCKFLGWSVGVKAGEQRVRLGVTLGRSPPFDGAGVGGCDSEQLPRMVKECSSFQTCKALVNLVLQCPSEARTESGSLRTPAHKLKFANEPPREILTIMSTSSKTPVIHCMWVTSRCSSRNRLPRLPTVASLLGTALQGGIAGQLRLTCPTIPKTFFTNAEHNMSKIRKVKVQAQVHMWKSHD